MKRFTIPMSSKLKRYSKHSSIRLNLHRFEQSKFVLEFECPVGKENSNQQYFIIDNELIPFLTKRNQIPFTKEDTEIGFKRVIRGTLRKDNEENLYTHCGNNVYKIPNMEKMEFDSSKFSFAFHLAHIIEKSKNKGLILRSSYQQHQRILNLLIGERKFENNEILLLNYYEDLVSSVKTMQIGSVGSRLDCVKISKDGMIGCIVVQNSHTPENDWEVVLIDLE